MKCNFCANFLSELGRCKFCSFENDGKYINDTCKDCKYFKKGKLNICDYKNIVVGYNQLACDDYYGRN